MQKSAYTFIALIFPCLLVQFLLGCIPVPIYHDVPAETESVDIPEHQFTRIVVAPYFHRAEVNEFAEALSEENKDIEAIDAETVFQRAFPDRDPNIEVTVSELLQPDVISRIREIGVRFIVVLSPYQTSSTEGGGAFIGVYAHGSSEISTSLMAGLIDLDKPASHEHLETEASGEDSATWILPYLGLFIFGNIPKTEESAMGGMAQEIVTKIRQEETEQFLKIMVIAGNWETAELSYQKEQALKELLERARQGNSEAQWEFYAESQTDENLVWLCRAADQGHARARNELGKLYFYGSEKYRKFDKVYVQANLSRSCMWFHLAGQAQITSPEGTNGGGLKVAPYESAEVERTTRVMSEYELEEAEKLIMAWEPGQCDRDFLLYLGTDYAKDPALAKLCAAADLGDFSSRDELGRIYFIGSRGVEYDLLRAYMWYRLAGAGSMQSLCNKMTAEQHSVAEQLLADWKPEQCEQALLSSGKP